MNDFARPPGRNCSSSMTRRTGRRGRATRLPQALWKGSTGIPRSTEDCTGHSAPTCGRCRSCGAGGHGVRREQEPSAADTTCWGGRGCRGTGGRGQGRGQGVGAEWRGVARSGAEARQGALALQGPARRRGSTCMRRHRATVQSCLPRARGPAASAGTSGPRGLCRLRHRSRVGVEGGQGCNPQLCARGRHVMTGQSCSLSKGLDLTSRP